MALLSEKKQFLLISVPHLVFYVFLARWNAQHNLNKARARHLPLKYYLEVKVEGTSVLATYFCLCFQLHVFKDICLRITDSFAAFRGDG